MHSHFPLDASQVVLLLVIAALIFGMRRQRWYSEQLSHDLLNRFFVYSAETTRAKEAEFIREPLPRKVPTALILLLALGVGAAIAWWLMR